MHRLCLIAGVELDFQLTGSLAHQANDASHQVFIRVGSGLAYQALTQPLVLVVRFGCPGLVLPCRRDPAEQYQSHQPYGVSELRGHDTYLTKTFSALRMLHALGDHFGQPAGFRLVLTQHSKLT